MSKRLIRVGLFLIFFLFTSGYLWAEVEVVGNNQAERSLLQLNILNVSEQWVADQKGIVITFSHDLKKEQTLSKFITVTEEKMAVKGEWKRLPGHTNSIYLSPINPGKTYQIFIRPGLSSANGLTLLKPGHFSLHTMDHQVEIEFADHETALSVGEHQTLQLRTTGLEQLSVKVLQVVPEKIVAFREYLQKNLENEVSVENVETLGDVVYEKLFQVEPLSLFSRKILEFDWADDQSLPSGVYLLAVEGLSVPQAKSTEKGAGEREDVATIVEKALFWFTVSDAYTLVRQYKDELVVYTGLKQDGKPLQGSVVQLFQQADADEKVSGKQGIVRFKKPIDIDNALVWVEGEQGVNIHPLSLEQGKSLNESLEHVVKGRLWLDQTYYKPGDDVEIAGLVRSDGEAFADKSISLRFKALNEHELFYRRVLTTSTFGDFETVYTLPDDVEGYYQVELYLPEEDQVLATERLHVAKVLPGDVDLTVNLNASRLSKQQHTLLNFQMEGLTENLTDMSPKISINRRIQLEAHPSKKYVDYTFGRSSDSKLSGFERFPVLQLDKDSQTELKIPAIKNAINSPLTFIYQAELMLGDLVYATAETTQTYWSHEALIGIKPIFETPYIDSLFGAEFEIIRINTNDDLLAADDLQVELFNVDQESNRKVAVSKRTLTFAENETGKLTLPVEQGFYELSVTDPETTMESRYAFTVDQAMDSKQVQKTLKLSLDKANYQPGEKAVLSFETLLESELLVFVEGSNMLAFETTHSATGKGIVELQLDEKWKNTKELNVTVVGFDYSDKSGSIERISASVPLSIQQNNHVAAVLENNELSFQLKGKANMEALLVLQADYWLTECVTNEREAESSKDLVLKVRFDKEGNAAVILPDSLLMLEKVKGFHGEFYFSGVEQPVYLKLDS
jgi:uncharacterized protein YfaS (alpha-2-macroglobulin family)